jgi:RNA recognition motif-containing protein
MEVKLYVGNLSFSTTEDDLRALFAQAGSVTSVALIKDRDSGQSKGFAFIEMSTQAEAESAIKKFNGYSLNNRELKVNTARPKEESSSRGGGGYGNRRY